MALQDVQQPLDGDKSGAAIESTEVIICGCGPTGAMLSVLLSNLGVKNVCLEKEADIVTDPRGIALDEDGIRALQAAGVSSDVVYSEIGQCIGMLNFIGGIHSDLQRAPIMRMDYGTSEGGTGHVGFIGHKQPTLEMHLRNKIKESSCSTLKSSCTVLSIHGDPNGVTVAYANADGFETNLRGGFLVGADGKTGFTRKRYLESKGVLMEQISQIGSYAETWVAINLRLTLPTTETHPNFALWKLGYTPAEIYDLYFPRDFRFLCNPDRPAVCGRFGMPDDRLWRFEYVVKDVEDPVEMASYESIRRIVFPYLTHPGRRYGLSHDIAFPEDCIEVLRSRPFFFSARSCNIWALDRVLICGDAAHVFPPYGGQGIVSGFRDAMSLAWRLKVACHHLPGVHEHLFRAWYLERKQQLEHSLASTVENGRAVTERNAFRILVRDTYLALLQLVPAWKRWLEQGARRDGMCRYVHQPGLHFVAQSGGGVLLPQVYCRKVNIEDSGIQFTDDIIYSQWKSGSFQILVIVHSSKECDNIEQQLRSLDISGLSSGFANPYEETVLVHDLDVTFERGAENAASERQSIQKARIASAAEFAASTLCENRPAPRYYDPYRIRKEFPDKQYIVLRPDRFTFAACANTDELCSALQLIVPTLSGQKAVQ